MSLIPCENDGGVRRSRVCDDGYGDVADEDYYHHHREVMSMEKKMDSPQLRRIWSKRSHPPETIAYLSRGKTHYRLQGDPSGELIVLVHGFGLLYSMWDKMIEVLHEAGYQTLTYDMYGMGFSDSPRRISHNIDLLVGQIDELLKWIGVPESVPFNLIGFSQGGCVSASYAKLHPHRIKSLILIAPAGLSPYSYLWTKPLVLGGTILAYIVESRPIGSIARRLMQALSSFVAFACKIEMPPTEEEVRKLLARKYFSHEEQLKTPLQRRLSTMKKITKAPALPSTSLQPQQSTLSLTPSPTSASILASSGLPSSAITPMLMTTAITSSSAASPSVRWDLVSTVLYDLGQMARQAYIALRSEMYFYSLSHLSVHGRLCTLRDFPFFQDLSEDVYRHVGKYVEKTMVVWGTKDRMLRYKEGLVDHIKAILPNARLEVIQGVGHSVIVEKCVLLQNLLLEFLTSTREDKDKDEETETAGGLKELQSSASMPSLSLEFGEPDDNETELSLLAPPMVNASCPNLSKTIVNIPQQSSSTSHEEPSLTCMKQTNTPGIVFPASSNVSTFVETANGTTYVQEVYECNSCNSRGGILPFAYKTVATTTKIAFNLATLPCRLAWFPVKTSTRIVSTIVRSAVDTVIGTPADPSYD